MPLAPEVGRLLVATPGLRDPNFFRSVILLCRYGREEGAFGLILNRPTEIEIGKVVPELAEGRSETLWLGGPVEGRSLWVVHRRSDLPERGDEVLDGVYFGAHPTMIRRLLRSNAPDVDGGIFRLFVGYAGWTVGQLEEEIAEGAWNVVPIGSHGIFNGTTGTLWGEMLLRGYLPCARHPEYIRDAWLN